jgi:hypothetical protein
MDRPLVRAVHLPRGANSLQDDLLRVWADLAKFRARSCPLRPSCEGPMLFRQAPRTGSRGKQRSETAAGERLLSGDEVLKAPSAPGPDTPAALQVTRATEERSRVIFVAEELECLIGSSISSRRRRRNFQLKDAICTA